MPSRIHTLTVDAADPMKLARFWSAVLDYTIEGDEGDEEVLIRPRGDGVDILFGWSPDAKSVKNRLHLDLNPDDRDAEVARLKGLGAKEVDIGQKDVTWVVMADPEGNEFCVLRPR